MKSHLKAFCFSIDGYNYHFNASKSS